MHTTTSRIGSSCPWRVVAPADLTPIARTLEACRTRPQVRAMLTAEAASAVSPTVDSFSPIYTCEHSTEEKLSSMGQPVSWGGATVDAPGFSQDQFDRAMTRAFADDLRIHELAGGQYLVCHGGQNGGYHVTRGRCDCKAGQAGTPCKHRAVLIAHLDIRVPHVAKQWAQLQGQHGGKVVA